MKVLSGLMIIGVLILAGVVQAEETKTTDHGLSLKGNWQTSLRTRYLGSVGAIIHDGPVLENELTLTFGNRWYAGFWSSIPFDKQGLILTPEAGPGQTVEFSDPRLASAYQLVGQLKTLQATLHPSLAPVPFEGEVDLYLGYKLNLQHLSLDWSFWWYDFNQVGKYDDDQWSGQLLLTYTKYTRVKPWVRVAYYGETGEASPPGGVHLYSGISFNQKLLARSDGSEQSLNIDLSTSWSDGQLLGIDPGLVYVRAKVSTDFKLWDGAYLSPSLLYQRLLTEGSFAEKDEFVASVGLKINF